MHKLYLTGEEEPSCFTTDYAAEVCDKNRSIITLVAEMIHSFTHSFIHSSKSNQSLRTYVPGLGIL